MPKTPERSAWQNMRDRCNNPNCVSFDNYGLRGIRVCDEWQYDYQAFLRHVGPRPSPRHSLDRIDNNGHYEPGNVRWADKSTQLSNRRTNRLLTFSGETLTMSQWALRLGISFECLKRRLDHRHWSEERALTTPKTPYGQHRKGKRVGEFG
jgi:hypothetical protein